ncbi:MAG: sulfotransferase [Chloroflexi bacterium]|nr:sulfotransferase [Chloroflexota bacterium]
MEMDELVFIVGCPRTGSTLLRQILNKSERICITSETHFMRRLSRVGRQKKLAAYGDLQDEANVDRFLDYLYSEQQATATGYWGWFNRTVPRPRFKERLLASDRSERAIFALLMQVYVEARQDLRTDMILGEKTPTNFYYVPTLYEWFPQVKIIHTFRDPRAIFISAAKLVRAGKWGVKEKLPTLPSWLMYGLLDMIELIHITKTWLDAVRLHALYERTYGDRYYLLRFEELVSNPEEQVQKLCNFLNVPYDPAMLDELAVVGSSFQPQRRVKAAGLDKKTAGRWQTHIGPFAKTWFSLLGRKHLARLGYPP